MGETLADRSRLDAVRRPYYAARRCKQSRALPCGSERYSKKMECQNHVYMCARSNERGRKYTPIENLRGFIREIMESWPLGDVDGGALQDLAIKYGLLKLKEPPPTEPCSDECTCGYAYEFGDFAAGLVECYERTELMRWL